MSDWNCLNNIDFEVLYAQRDNLEKSLSDPNKLNSVELSGLIRFLDTVLNEAQSKGFFDPRTGNMHHGDTTGSNKRVLADPEEELNFQSELATQFKYKSLDKDLSKEVKERYLNTLPAGLNLQGNAEKELRTREGTVIAKGYTRVVIGDYGAFVEFSPEQAVLDNITVKSGQEYRMTDRYRNNVKYFWYTAKDKSDVKIYLQQRTVSYADYRPNMYYVSPFELMDAYQNAVA